MERIGDYGTDPAGAAIRTNLGDALIRLKYLVSAVACHHRALDKVLAAEAPKSKIFM
jgi:hypothetical protein